MRRLNVAVSVPCWWCGATLAIQNGRLLYQPIETPSGVVNVHKGCADATRAHFRAITAQPIVEGLTPRRPPCP